MNLFATLKPQLPLEGNRVVTLHSITNTNNEKGGYTNLVMKDKETNRLITETIFLGKPEAAEKRVQSILNSIARQLDKEDFAFEVGLEFTINIEFNELYRRNDIKFYPVHEIETNLNIEVA